MDVNIIKSEIIIRLFEVDAVKFGNFILKSKTTSPIYIDFRGIISSPDLMASCMYALSHNKKLSYCWETSRRKCLPKIAEMDVEMTTQAELTFKCPSRSSKVVPIES